ALPAPAFLSGRLLGPEGASFAGMRVFVTVLTQEEGVELDDMFFSAESDNVTVSTAGTFRIGPVRAGDAELFLRLPPIVLSTEDSTTIIEGKTIELGRVVLSP